MGKLVKESYEEFVNEVRSESSKIAKRANSKKGTVEAVQDFLSELTAEEISEIVSKKLDIPEKEAKNILKQMGKIYGGNISITIEL
jgi:ribosomal protein L11